MTNLDIYNPTKVRGIVEQLTAERDEAREGIRAAHRILDQIGVQREDEVSEDGLVRVTEYPVCDRIKIFNDEMYKSHTAMADALRGMLDWYEDAYGVDFCECDSSVDLTCRACIAHRALPVPVAGEASK